MPVYTQVSFSGGMNQLTDDIKLQPNQYSHGKNLRSRYDVLECVTEPTDITANLIGPLQAIFNFADKLLVVDAGDIKIWDEPVGTWITLRIQAFNNQVSNVYVQHFPASTLNFKRELEDADIVNAEIKVTPTAIQQYPAGVILQDGESDPITIVQDPGGKLTIDSINSDKEKWDYKLLPEYTPIGKRMAMLASKLFVVGEDKVTGTESRIYHSIAGRPIDFMLAITGNGEPTRDSDGNIYGADATAHAVDYNRINAIRDLNNSALLVGTDYAIYMVELDDSLKYLFGEPQFRNTKLFDAGVVNQWSLVDLLGDIGFIDYEGVKTFNAVEQVSNEGRNSIFSRTVGRLFDGIIQSPETACAINYDNYALFALDSTKGAGVLVYDTLNSAFPSFDQFLDKDKEPIVPKRFAKVISPAAESLYCYTTKNKVYHLYPPNGDYATAEITLRSLVPTLAETELLDLSKEHKGVYFRFITTNADVAGEAMISEYRDNMDASISRKVPYNKNLTSQSVPLMSMTAGMATKLIYKLQWKGMAQVPYIQIITEDKRAEVSNSQRRAINDS